MRFNLLPHHERGRSKPGVDGVRVAWIAAVTLLLVVGLFTVFNVMNANITANEEADLFARVSGLRVERSALNRMRTDNDELDALLDELDESFYVEKNLAAIRLLADSTRALPGDAWLDFYAMNPGRDAYASGYAMETGDLSRLLRGLQAAEDVGDVQLTTMDRIDEPGGFRREFSINLTVKGWEP